MLEIIGLCNKIGYKTEKLYKIVFFLPEQYQAQFQLQPSLIQQ